jgi:hypothetical protein
MTRTSYKEGTRLPQSGVPRLCPAMRHAQAQFDRYLHVCEISEIGNAPEQIHLE